jgi:hypothetical protein
LNLPLKKILTELSIPREHSAVVYKEGSHVYAKNENGSIICTDSPTACLQEAVNYLAQLGGGRILVKRGTYRMYGITIPENVSITIEGENGAEIKFGGAAVAPFDATYSATTTAGTIKTISLKTYVFNKGILRFRNVRLTYDEVNTSNPPETAIAGPGTHILENIRIYDPTCISFIYVPGGSLIIRDVEVEQLGDGTCNKPNLGGGNPLWDAPAYVDVKNLTVDKILTCTDSACSASLLTSGDVASKIDGLVIKYFSGTRFWDSFLVGLLRNVVILDGSVADRFTITDFINLDNLITYLPNTYILENPGCWQSGCYGGFPFFNRKINRISISNVKFFAPTSAIWYIDLGHPPDGMDVSVSINDVFCPTPNLNRTNCIYGGPYRVWQVNKVTCIDTSNCIGISNEGGGTHPVSLHASDIHLRVTGQNLFSGYTFYAFNAISLAPNLANITEAVLNNLIVRAESGPSDMPVNAVNVAGDNPLSQHFALLMNNVYMNTYKFEKDGGPRLNVIRGNRAYETQFVRISNSYIITRTPPLGGFTYTAIMKWGAGLGRLDRIINSTIIDSYYGTAIPIRRASSQLTVTPGTNNTYGNPAKFTTNCGEITSMQATISVSNIASGETITIMVQAVYENGTTSYREYTYGGSPITITLDDIATSMITVSRVEFYAKSNLSSTSASVSISVKGIC